jgi:hypothetical protein
MVKVARQLILAMALLAMAGLLQAAGFRLWPELQPEEQHALAPIANDWNHFPAQQQEKLLKVAKGYAKLSPKQQEMFHRRLQSWTRLTPEQRKIARENYQKLLQLPQEKQVQIKRKWMQAQETRQAAPQVDAQQIDPGTH